MDVLKRFSNLLIPGLAVIFTILGSTPVWSKSNTFNNEEVRERVLAMNALMTPKYTNEVAVKLKSYLVYGRSYSERLLGKRSLYFHIFEKHLREADLPEELKYLTIVESALIPTAKSRVGAVGLWQFMPSTARERGLRITRYIDERRDPELATRAAVDHLKRLFDIYGDWALAMAAYNSGPGRVNKAIRLANSTDFWKIRPYLPKETRNYVPAFIAANYLFTYYKDHELAPRLPDLDLQFVESTIVYDQVNFAKLSEITGLSIKVIRQLNPMFRMELIPATQYGLRVVLPSRVMHLFKAYLGIDDNPEFNESADQQDRVTADSLGSYHYKEILYRANKGELLTDIAAFFNCESYQIKYWNDLRADELASANALTIFLPFENPIIEAPVNFVTYRRNIDIAFIDHLSFDDLGADSSRDALPVNEVFVTEPRRVNFYQKQNTFHRIRKGETLRDIAKKYRNVEVRDIIRMNNISKSTDLRPGIILKIQE